MVECPPNILCVVIETTLPLIETERFVTRNGKSARFFIPPTREFSSCQVAELGLGWVCWREVL